MRVDLAHGTVRPVHTFVFLCIGYLVRYMYVYTALHVGSLKIIEWTSSVAYAHRFAPCARIIPPPSNVAEFLMKNVLPAVTTVERPETMIAPTVD